MEEKPEPKGFMTCTNTSFGRHYYAFRTLEDDLKKSPKEHLDCLIIGPGIDSGAIGKAEEGDRFIRTYQPFELANAIVNSDIGSFVIDIVDIQSSIFAELRKNPPMLSVFREFWNRNYYRGDDQHISERQEYYDNFFPDYVVSSEDERKIVRVPDSVIASITPETRDIISDRIPDKKYDVIVCTTVMSHYLCDSFRNPEIAERAKELIQDMRDSVSVGGYMITTETVMGNDVWALLRYRHMHSGSVHSESAGLSKKIK